MSQRQQVLNHLREHGFITPLDALRRYGCFRLSARIYELRSQGYPIVCMTRQPYARYELQSRKQN